MKQLSIFFLLVLSRMVCFAQTYTLWGDLPKGKYQVGFKRSYGSDHSRVYHLNKLDGSLPSGKAPRPIVVSIWYPTADSKRTFMKYSDYFKMPSHKFPTEKYKELLEDYNLKNFAACFSYDEKLFSDKNYKLPQKEQIILDKLLSTSTAAHQDAVPAIGKFPLAIHHQGLGGTLEDNSVMCEFLASHGYVVVSSAFQAEEYPDMNVNWDTERSAKDIDFIFNLLQGEKYIDFSKVAAIGHSYGAQAMAAYACKINSPIDLLVSIDPTFDYEYNFEGGFKKLFTQLLAHRQNMDMPVLAIARGERNPLFLLWDSMSHANRYYVSVPLLKHNDFTSQGALHSFFDLRNTPDSSDNKKIWINYQHNCLVILDLITTHFEPGKSDAIHTIEERCNASGFSFEYIPEGQRCNRNTCKYDTAAGVPPSAYQMANLMRLEHGVEVMSKLSEKFKNANVFSEESINEVGYALLNENKRIDAVITLFEWNAKRHPGSWNVWDSLGEAYMIHGDKQKAKEFYSRSLLLNEKNDNAKKILKTLSD